MPLPLVTRSHPQQAHSVQTPSARCDEDARTCKYHSSALNLTQTEHWPILDTADAHGACAAQCLAHLQLIATEERMQAATRPDNPCLLSARSRETRAGARTKGNEVDAKVQKFSGLVSSAVKRQSSVLLHCKLALRQCYLKIKLKPKTC